MSILCYARQAYNNAMHEALSISTEKFEAAIKKVNDLISGTSVASSNNISAKRFRK